MENSKPVINVVIADIGSFEDETRDFEGVATYPPPLKTKYAESGKWRGKLVSGIVRVLWPSVYWGLGIVFIDLMGYPTRQLLSSRVRTEKNYPKNDSFIHKSHLENLSWKKKNKMR